MFWFVAPLSETRCPNVFSWVGRSSLWWSKEFSAISSKSYSTTTSRESFSEWDAAAAIKASKAGCWKNHWSRKLSPVTRKISLMMPPTIFNWLRGQPSIWAEHFLTFQTFLHTNNPLKTEWKEKLDWHEASSGNNFYFDFLFGRFCVDRRRRRRRSQRFHPTNNRCRRATADESTSCRAWSPEIK